MGASASRRVFHWGFHRISPARDGADRFVLMFFISQYIHVRFGENEEFFNHGITWVSYHTWWFTLVSK
jgi:hypothetical protein